MRNFKGGSEFLIVWLRIVVLKLVTPEAPNSRSFDKGGKLSHDELLRF